jgi:hypothetical protein
MKVWGSKVIKEEAKTPLYPELVPDWVAAAVKDRGIDPRRIYELGWAEDVFGNRYITKLGLLPPVNQGAEAA